VLDLATIAADRAARLAYWRDRGAYSDLTYAEALAEGAARHADARVIYHSRVRPETATVQEGWQASERLASAFHALGLGRGDAIAVMLPTWYDAVLAYMAALKLGMTVVPIVAIYGGRELGFIVRQTGAKALLVPDSWRGHDYLERVRQAGDMPSLQHLMVIGPRRPSGALDWDELRAHTATDYPRAKAEADDVCCILYTSGTTAEPKGVKHSHNTQLCDINTARGGPEVGPMTMMGPSGAGPALCVFPAGHVAGYLAMMRPFLFGGDGIFMDQWIAEDAARLIETHRVSASTGTPIFLSTLMKAADDLGADLSSLKSFALGASAITAENIRWTDRLGFPSGRSYGMTEHPTVSVGAAGDAFEKRAYTDGRITPHNEVRIVDEDGADVPIGETGEIATRGPRLFVGYVDETLDRACFLPGGWYRSGDIGRLDGEGYLTVTDRKKDIIIRGGENISAKEIEELLATLPGVLESAVTAMPDPVMGERVCAFVVLRDGASLTLPQVDARFRELGVARQKTPERLVLVDDFPRTPSGKIRKVELRAQLRAGAARVAG
jgi:non-ribosomal peptide synthetase component E (peptide arylation enzyme)